jgi:hypothetical protein
MLSDSFFWYVDDYTQKPLLTCICIQLVFLRQLLLANRFLTIIHVSKAMEHYEKLVDMGRWYEDDNDHRE